jgi:hypothetical protein
MGRGIIGVVDLTSFTVRSLSATKRSSVWIVSERQDDILFS